MITSLSNIKIFFQPAYLLNPNPVPDTKFMTLLVAFFGILVILSGVFFLLARKSKKKKKPSSHIFFRICNWFFSIGIVGLLLLFFRYEGTPFLSMRLLLTVWILVFFLWGIGIVWFRFRGYKKIVKEMKEKEAKEKYFRKSK